MQKRTAGILTGIFLLFAFGLANNAVAHTAGTDDAIPSPNRAADWIYSTLDVPCSTNGWNSTDPSSNLMGDADGDGICDGWELGTGLFIDFTPPAGYAGAGQKFNYSYPCGSDAGQDPNCPSRYKKDVYLELDWMEDPANSHVPLDGVVQAIIDAWAAAPVSNLDGTTGITLHVQYGEWPAASTPSQTGDIQWHKNTLYTNLSYQTAYPGFYRLKQHTFGTMDERFADGGSSYAYNGTFQKNPNYTNALVKNTLTAKFQIFHYDLIINKRAEQASSSGWAEVWGNDHVWSLGGWSPVMGNAEQQKAIFMHEFGHNFNLDHGGTDIVANKPNYFSVMNPVFQLVYPDGKDNCRPLDYSRKAMNSLNENSLSEPAGIEDSSGDGYLYPSSPWSCISTGGEEVAGTERFFWYSTPGSSTLNAFDRTNQAVNWNNAAPVDTQTGLSQSINADGTKQTLTSINDWTSLQFDFGSSSYAQSNRAEGEIADPDAPPAYPQEENCEDVPSDITSPFQRSFTTGCRELTFTEPRPSLLPSPLQQIKNGVAPENVVCKDDLTLVKKSGEQRAACVSEDTANALVKRGWGAIVTK